LGLAALLNEAAKKPEFKGRFQRRLFGVLVWGPESQRCNDHFGEIPTTLGAFFDWADAYQLPVRAALDAYLKEDLHLFGGIPLTLAIRRPMTVLGATTDIELINFVVHASGDHWPKDGSWDLAAEVSISDHRTPLSPEFARYLSSLDKSAETGRILLFGAGALGSKVAMHLGRSGQVNLRMIDQANFAPHNVVRHTLGGESVGASKAEGVANAIVKLYAGMDDLPVKGEIASALPFLVGDKLSELSDCQHVIDATASPVVFNALSNASIPTMTRVSRVEIADRGEIGILSVEGEARNPRLDDLQVLLYDSAIDDQLLSKWLTGVQARRDNQIGSGLEEIQIGLSCSSATMRIADEVVSYHAAAMTRRLRGYLTPTISLSAGALFKSFISDDGDARAETLHVKPFAIVTARNNSAWQIRFASAVSDEMFSALKRASPSETGGLLVGLINKKRRIVYVTRLLRAPRDSTGTPAAFVRGVFNLPQAIRDIETRSGGLLGYIGEWHTHPEGGADLSPVDEIAVANLRSVLDPVDIPTLVSIVTPDGIHPHLLEASSPPIVPRLARPISLREFCLRLVRRNRRENRP
jgi:hypothetical protein